MKCKPTKVLFLTLPLLAAACTRVRTPDYETATYRDWSAAGSRALRDRLSIRPSFEELVRFPEDRAAAVGYRLDLQRGQRLQVDVSRRTAAHINIEIFEEIGPGEPIFRLVKSAAPDEGHVDFEAHTDGPHVIRVQPEMSKGGEVLVKIATAASLTFPVLGKTKRAIQSGFGDPRDGGKRDHEGVDIFSGAGTPVVAVADGIVTSVATTPIGGNVVWEEDPARNVSYYYAHLKSQTVRPGDRVHAGDQLGTVGNTGNAKTSSPHLHFGVYKGARVAIDPVPFLFDQPGELVGPLLVDESVIGSTTRLRNDQTVYVIGGVRDRYRVLLQDGREAYVPSRDVVVPYSVKGAH